MHAIVQLRDYLWWWFFYHGVPGNLAASAILGVPTVVMFHVKVWRKHIKPHLQKLHEVHAHLNPDHPFTLGGDDDGKSSTGR